MELVYYRHNKNIRPKPLERKSIFFNELKIVLDGIVIYSVNDEKIVLNAGDAVYIESGGTRARPNTDETADYVSFNFQTDTPIELPQKISNALTGEVKLLIACADEIQRKYYSDSDRQIAGILQCIVGNIKSNLCDTKESWLVRYIKQYLNRNLSQKITLENIGRETFFSPVYCDIVFKRETGFSIIAFLLDLRVNEAKKLLSDGTLSLQKIAETVGFDDYNYFSRTFKKHTGYTPNEYRKLFLFF